MKFLAFEHKAFTSALVAKGVDMSEIEFSKKRGVISVVHKPSAMQFTFYRKTSTTLGSDLKMTKEDLYYLSKDQSEGFSWESTLIKFGEWVQRLN